MGVEEGEEEGEERETGSLQSRGQKTREVQRWDSGKCDHKNILIGMANMHAGRWLYSHDNTLRILGFDKVMTRKQTCIQGTEHIVMHLLFEGAEVSLSPGQSYHLSPTLNQGLHCGSTNTFTLIKPPEKATLLLLCYFPLYYIATS